jgi:hypothetical protein
MTTYKNVKFDNITLTDTAETTTAGPIGNAGIPTNQGLVLSNVHVAINKWAGQEAAPFPTIAGEGNTVSLDYAMLDTPSQHLKAQTGTVELELQASPATVRVGQTTTLSWLSRGANSCSGSGAWSSSVGFNGSRTVTMTKTGSYYFTFACRNANSTTTTTASVVVSQ